MKVAANRDICIGAGMCVLTAPTVFDQGDDGIVTLLSTEDVDAEHAARQAVTQCPSGALRVVED